MSRESFAIGTLIVLSEDGKQGEHGVKVQAWNGQPSHLARSRWVSNVDKVRVEFEEEVR